MPRNPTSLQSPIRMGQMAVAMNDGAIRTLLGSCIGLALYDRKRKVGGLAHIVLPDSRGKTELPAKFVDTAIPALVHAMEKLAGSGLEMTAKIAGGANMFSMSVTKTIGVQNIEATEQLLEDLRIPIVARHVGGEQGRRMSLDTTTGRVVIEIVGSETFEI